MPRLVRTRLSAMMFLWYAALGAWMVTAGTFLLSSPLAGGLNFTTAQVGWIYSTFALAAMIANPFVGLLADRLFHAERVFAAGSLSSAAFLFLAANWCEENIPRIDAEYRAVAAAELVDGVPVLAVHAALPAGPVPDAVKLALDRVNDDPRMRASVSGVFWPLFGLMLAQSICMQVAMPLTTVLSLRNLPDRDRFARVRLFGTIGWIAAGVALGWLVNPMSAGPLYLGALIAAVVAGYALTLPPTPPKGGGRSLGEVFGVPALKLFREKPFVVFILVALLSAQMNQFYGVYAHRFLTDAGFARAERWMTIGQVIEVGCMFAIPLLKPKKSMKWLMFAGAAGAAVRGAVLAWGSLPLIAALGIPMHGWNYALFFIVGLSSFLDREAPPQLRASAQALAMFLIGGVGPWTGNMIAAATVDHYRVGTVIDWAAVWVVPLVGCGVAAVAFAALFRTPPERGDRTEGPDVMPPSGPEPGR